MGTGLRFLALTLLATATAAAAVSSLELCGRVAPPPARATVVIGGVGTAFSARTSADSQGRFRFRKLAPGPYIVTVFAPGLGATRRSVEVTPSLADAGGRVETTIPFSPSTVVGPRPRAARNTVSVSELAISDRARREYAEALKKLRKQDTDGAAVHLKQAVSLAPQYMMAWNELGSLAVRAQNWAEAERCFRKALELRPGALGPALNLGSVLLNRGKLREALDFNRIAWERSPNNAVASFQLGMTYYMLEQDDQALEYLQTAKRLDPGHFSGPQLVLADLYLRHGDRATAIGELRDFLARHPDAAVAPKVRDQIARLTP